MIAGFEHLLRCHLACLALVRAGLFENGGGAILLVSGVPGLDGAPGELETLTIGLDEGLLADVTDASDDGVAGR